MKRSFTWMTAIAAAGILSATLPAAAGGKEMGQAELEALLKNGRTVQLGGPGMGYSGKLELRADGTGQGQAKTDAGDTINIKGNWEVRGGKFCRQWAGLDGGSTVCETWVPAGANTVDVFKGDQQIGRNSW